VVGWLRFGAWGTGREGRFIVAVHAADEAVPGVVTLESLEVFAIGHGDGLQEDLREIDQRDGGFGWNTAVRNGGKEPSEGVVEGGAGNERTRKGSGDIAGGGVGLAELADLALVVEAVFGLAGRTKHAAMTAIGIGKSTQRRAVFGVVGGHRRLQNRRFEYVGKSLARGKKVRRTSLRGGLWHCSYIVVKRKMNTVFGGSSEKGGGGRGGESIERR